MEAVLVDGDSPLDVDVGLLLVVPLPGRHPGRFPDQIFMDGGSVSPLTGDLVSLSPPTNINVAEVDDTLAGRWRWRQTQLGWQFVLECLGVDAVVSWWRRLVLVLLLRSDVTHTVRGVFDALAASACPSGRLPAMIIHEHLLDLFLDGSPGLVERLSPLNVCLSEASWPSGLSTNGDS